MIEIFLLFLREYGLIALFLASFSSNFLLFPAFVEVSCIVFLSLNFSPLSIFISLISGSVLGGIASYYLGLFSSKTILKHEERIEGMQKLIEKYGNFSVFLVSFLPVPFPFAIFAMLVGFLKMDVKSFLFAIMAGKGLRIALVLFVLKWSVEILKIFGLI
ncbi:MAG: VTT domain-containing protein [Candidatus Aenigmatarchaeota archaeon]